MRNSFTTSLFPFFHPFHHTPATHLVAVILALQLHDSIMRAMLKRFNGYEVKTEGDAFMVAFFTVAAAVGWCRAVQRALLQATWPAGVVTLPYAQEVRSATSSLPLLKGIRVRMGIHTGKPSCRRNPVTGRMDYFGPMVNRTARVSDGYVVTLSNIIFNERQ